MHSLLFPFFIVFFFLNILLGWCGEWAVWVHMDNHSHSLGVRAKSELRDAFPLEIVSCALQCICKHHSHCYRH